MMALETLAGWPQIAEFSPDHSTSKIPARSWLRVVGHSMPGSQPAGKPVPMILVHNLPVWSLTQNESPYFPVSWHWVLVENVGSGLKCFSFSRQQLKPERIQLVLLRKAGPVCPFRKVPVSATTGTQSFILRGNLTRASVVRETFFYNSCWEQTFNLYLKIGQ